MNARKSIGIIHTTSIILNFQNGTCDSQDVSENVDVLDEEIVKKKPVVYSSKPAADKLNVSPFLLIISIFLTISILMSNHSMRAIIIRSVRDFAFYGVPIVWVLSKEEIKVYAKHKLNQAMARQGYY